MGMRALPSVGIFRGFCATAPCTTCASAFVLVELLLGLLFPQGVSISVMFKPGAEEGDRNISRSFHYPGMRSHWFAEWPWCQPSLGTCEWCRLWGPVLHMQHEAL